MARYRRNWNGLTEIKPDSVFIPENMELNVFPVPKRPKIEVVAVRKKSHRNTILKAVTAAAAVAYFGAACTMHRPTVAAGIVIGVSLAWMTLFVIANRGRR